MQSQSDSPNKPTNSLSQLAQSLFSNNNSTIMLAAIVSLLLVILFVLLLHVYAKWFLAQSNQPQPQARRRRRRIPVEVSGGFGPPQFHNIRIEESPVLTKGLDSATVSAIPLFVYEAEEAETEELECVICLSGFEVGEIGRCLPKCGHAFHVECIDMWLSSHSNCPICRANIVCGVALQNENNSLDGNGDDDPGFVEIAIGTPSYEISESGNDSFGGGGGGVSGSVSETSSSSLLGCSLKRMLSKVFLSSNLSEIEGSQ